MNWSKITQRILKQADNTQQNLILLISGFGVCMLGLLMVIMAEYLFGNSLRQELLALLGIICIVAGLIMAAIGHISLSFLRLIRFLQKDKSRK